MDPRNPVAKQGLDAKDIIEVLRTGSELPELVDEVRDLSDFLHNLQHRYPGIGTTFEVEVRRGIEVFDELIGRIEHVA